MRATEQIILRCLTTIEEISKVITIDKNIALESAECHRELMEKAKKRKLKAPSLFDAIVLATARKLNAKIVTGNEHFKQINEALWIGKT